MLFSTGILSRGDNQELANGFWTPQSTKYQVWLKTKKQTLFCPGIPGAGKTILTSIVIDDMITRFQGDPSVGIAYIYCNVRQQDEQNVENLLASLIQQLVQGRPSLPEGLKVLYNRCKAKQTQPLLDEISRTLQSIATMYSIVFIIIDALDECQVSDDCRTRFLSETFSLQAKCGVNIFATSRFIPEIIEKFDGSISLEIRAQDQDVRKYIQGRILQSESKFLKTLNEEIQTEITGVVDGM